LSAAVGLDRAVEELANAQRLTKLCDAMPGKAHLHAPQPGVEFQVRAATEAAIDDGLLKDDAAYAASAERLLGHIEAGELGRPTGRLDRCREHPDRRRLSGAVGSEQPEHLTVRDLKVDTLHRFDPARIGLGELHD